MTNKKNKGVFTIATDKLAILVIFHPKILANDNCC